MTTVTQKIPNLLRGISQQPDVKKFPGEVRDCVNAFPEYALGLMKRPGAKLEAPLRGVAMPGDSATYPGSLTRYYGATEKWFNINIDGVPYVGQINDFSYTSNGSKDQLSLQLWYKESGLPRVVNIDNYMQSGYISSGSWSTYQGKINDETDALGNKITGLSTFQDAQKAWYAEYLKTIDQFENITSISTDYQLGNVNQFVTSGVLVDGNGNESYIKDDVTMSGVFTNGELTSSDILTGGENYADGTYNNVALTGGTGNSAAANITISGGVITIVTVVNKGSGYTNGDVLSATDADLGGGGGSNFECTLKTYKKGVEVTGDYPILMDVFPRNYKLYQLIAVTKASDSDGTALDTYETNTYNPAQDVYDNPATGLVKLYNDAVNTTDNFYPTLNTSVLPINGASNYFVDDVAGGGAKVDLSELKLFTFQDTTFILNPKKKVEYTTDKTPIAKFDEGFVFFKIIQEGVFNIQITRLLNDLNGKKPHEDGYLRTLDTAFGTNGTLTADVNNNNNSHNTIELLVEGLRDDFVNQDADFPNEWIFEEAGNGVYIASTPAEVSVNAPGGSGNSRTPGVYFLHKDGNLNGTDALLRVDVHNANQTPYVTVHEIGSGFVVGETITITDSEISGGSAADITVTIDDIKTDRNQFELKADGPTDDTLGVIRHEVNQVSELPIQLKNGYKVKVVNTLDVNADDMYLVFESEQSDDTYGVGTWVETNGRDINYIIDKNTMPHALTVNADGSFSFGPWNSWENRLVGDEITNPTPHFISVTGSSNRFIKDMFVYRNRLGFLTEDYVSLSRAGEFFNFFVKSAVASGDDDPIDISVSDSDSPSLNYVSKETAGLLLYGKTGQYLLATDSDILSPTTAKINKVAGFEADISNPAISLGSTTAFISKTQSTTKMFELLKVNALEPPQSVEQTRTVPELVPTTVDSVIGSPDVGIVSFGTIGQKTLYHFSYLRMGGQELSRSWYKWELPGTLLHQFFDGNEFHCLVRTNQNETAVVSFDVAQSSSTGILELDSGKKTDLVLDLYDDKPFITYQGIVGGIYVDKTRIYLPLDKLSDEKLVIVMYSNRSQVFDEDKVTLTEVNDVALESKYVEVDGDWRGSDVFIGYKYNMSVELPRIYYKTARDQQVDADVDAELIIHKLKVKTGLTGPIDYKINIIGIPVRTSKLTVTPAGQYNLNSVNMTESAVHHVPVYQRNHNTTITIESNTAFPATIESINWEGRYANNYYRRA